MRQQPQNNDFPAPLSGRLGYPAEVLQAYADRFPDGFRWTVSALEKYFPSDLNTHLELLENALCISPPPFTQHKGITMRLLFALDSFCNGRGLVLGTPLDVVFDENNLVQPDILFVSEERSAILNDYGVSGAPDMVVEMWSHPKRAAQRDKKRRLYAERGVRELWQIFPEERYVRVEVLEAQTKTFVLFSEAVQSGILRSSRLEGFHIEANELFNFQRF